MTDKSGSWTAGDKTVARDPRTPLPSYERFSPGDVLDERYRIVALLGKGGMGEVYRADDLKLGQPVALKFLPHDVFHPAALERLYSEVRLGRRISHPNVCRLYDIGEWKGNHFVTMEYIDGEDLASLLRRIGELPRGKAVELAQNICAGLAAAHGIGVVHRDLKPANIMIDGRGHAIITDFGLAALAEELEGRSETAGTPEYMAPEQLHGGEVTHKSDLYALGLILYEMFTGRRRYEGRSVAEIRQLHESDDPSSISRETKSIDPVIQQVVLRCLEHDPGERPRSIHSVIAALPGADPLQAALDAGETPSPAMVAAAGRSGELPVRSVAALVLAGILILVAAVWLKQRTELYGVRPLPNHPRVLEAEAREVLELTGFDAPRRDSSFYLGLDQRSSSARPDFDTTSIHPSPMVFHYRQSPEVLVPLRGHFGDHRILPYDPPHTLPGMARVILSPEGYLSSLLIVPRSEDLQSAQEPRWDLMFEKAGLDLGAATVVEPDVPAPVGSDQRISWMAPYTEMPDRTARVDAAVLGGQIVWFDVVPPWRQGWSGDRLTTANVVSNPADVIVTGLIIAALLGGLWVARRNLRRGRGDRRGAMRLWIAVFLALSAASLLRADLVGGLPHVWDIITERIGLAGFRAATIAILYLAIEPYLRRRWPTLLVSWSRLLAGGWRDPLVGQHVLLGVLGGIVVSVLQALPDFLATSGVSPGSFQSALTSGRQALAAAIHLATSGVLPP
ncbi:MAG: serine/threonine-protein kinase, partial [Thermoanaerobaculia bacterium]